ncbi:MAG: ATP-binding protein [Myxococcota bacterium]
MDDVTLKNLQAALAASPGNAPLATVVAKAHVARGELDEARRILGGFPAEQLDEETRLLAADLLLRAEDHARAATYCQGDSPATLMMRARVLLAQGERKAAQDAYQAAVEKNPTLENLDLKALLFAQVHDIQSARGMRMRVIANDDTARDDVARVLAPPLPPITFKDVGGLEGIKEQIRKRIILPFQKPSLFERFKKKAGGGILLYGPPGCGKTLLARATAGECKATFFNVNISDVLDMYIGESERKLHALFEKARQSAPCVMFFDELEALAARRQYSREGASARVVSQFLSEMDGFAQSNGGVLILGATNVPWAVDPAFRRPGRFDRVVFVPPPDARAREEILRLHLRERPTQPGLDLAAVIKATGAFTGADLASLVETASDAAIERSLAAEAESPISDADLRSALQEVKPTALEWLTTARNYARYANEGGQYDDVLAFLQAHGKA